MQSVEDYMEKIYDLPRRPLSWLSGKVIDLFQIVHSEVTSKLLRRPTSSLFAGFEQ